MIVRKPDRLIRKSSWPPGTWLPPDLCVVIHRRYVAHFRWHDLTPTHALHYSIHSTIGVTG
jgi:hypothetical protein